MRFSLIIISVLICTLSFGQAAVTATHLRVENIGSPRELDIAKPRLSWKINSSLRNVQQISYEINVASSLNDLANRKFIWSSGEVHDPSMIDRLYSGPTLVSNKDYYWQVRVNTNKGKTNWSKPQSWHTGLLKASDWKAKWIGMDSAFAWDSVTKMARLSARYSRKEFSISKTVKSAHAFVAGLGLHELYINGNKIGDYVLVPAPTDYSESVRYLNYDVTNQLKTGLNCIGTILGNGRFFTMRQNYKPQKWHNFGYPKQLVQLEIEYTDGTVAQIISDGSWMMTADGPIRSNNEYDGEEYDARKELGRWSSPGYNTRHWFPVALVSAPGGKLQGHLNPPMKVVQQQWAANVKSKGRTLIVDLGQNMAGWLRLNMHGKRGDTVRIRYAESLQPDGSLYTANLRDAQSTDVYIFSGSVPVQWQPRFVYHGFRYAEISGLNYLPRRTDIKAMIVADAMSPSGSFASSSANLNRLHQNAYWGIQSNYKGMPVDCPQRNERQPWLGDRATGCYGESFLFDNYQLYRKWMQDIRESQRESGSIPDVAPSFWYYYKDNMTWPGTYLMVGDMLLKQYGDSQVIREHYPAMKKWILYMKANYLKDGIMTKDNYGDWCVPPESPEMIHSRDSNRNTNPQLIATAYYVYMLQLMQKFADVTGNATDSKDFFAESEKEKLIFHQNFYNPAGYYGNSTVTANILPLVFNIVPTTLTSSVFNAIQQRIEVQDKGHISTGLIGTQWLMRTLSRFNRNDLAINLATVETYPGWSYMLANGATTIWELWNGNTANPSMNSQNHVMLLGDLLIWMYQDLGGIQTQASGQPYSSIILKPDFNCGLRFLKTSYEARQGTVVSEWMKGETSISYVVSVPAGTRAKIMIPMSLEGATEGGKPLQIVPDLYLGNDETGAKIIELGSGKYSFIFPKTINK